MIANSVAVRWFNYKNDLSKDISAPLKTEQLIQLRKTHKISQMLFHFETKLLIVSVVPIYLFTFLIQNFLECLPMDVLICWILLRLIRLVFRFARYFLNYLLRHSRDICILFNSYIFSDKQNKLFNKMSEVSEG